MQAPSASTDPLRILWIRHAPIVNGRRTRDAYLLPRLAREPDVEINIVTWHDAESVAGAHWKRLMFDKTESLGLPTWVLPKLPRPPGWPVWWPSINQPIFRLAVRVLERKLKSNVLVVGPCWTAMGYPPRTRAVRVFDYLDGGDWTHPGWRAADVAYLNWAECVLAVSDALVERARPFGKPVAMIPNGLELERLEVLQPQRAAFRSRFGFDGRRVVSLIGLTASSSLYWIDAIRRLAADVDGFLFVAAGLGPLTAPIEALARELPHHVRWLGAVPYEEALALFAASDVTWYPGDDTDYFHNASPLKVYEGLGAGTHVVVAPRLRSFGALDLPTLHFSSPTAIDLAETTVRALNWERPSQPASKVLAPFSWDVIASKAGQFLRNAVASRRGNSAASFGESLGSFR